MEAAVNYYQISYSSRESLKRVFYYHFTLLIWNCVAGGVGTAKLCNCIKHFAAKLFCSKPSNYSFLYLSILAQYFLSSDSHRRFSERLWAVRSWCQQADSGRWLQFLLLCVHYWLFSNLEVLHICCPTFCSRAPFSKWRAHYICQDISTLIFAVIFLAALHISVFFLLSHPRAPGATHRSSLPWLDWLSAPENGRFFMSKSAPRFTGGPVKDVQSLNLMRMSAVSWCWHYELTRPLQTVSSWGSPHNKPAFFFHRLFTFRRDTFSNVTADDCLSGTPFRASVFLLSAGLFQICCLISDKSGNSWLSQAKMQSTLAEEGIGA